MKIIVITQARTGSTRLPNKVLKKIKGKTLLNIHLERILKAKTINQLIILHDQIDLDLLLVVPEVYVLFD